MLPIVILSILASPANAKDEDPYKDAFVYRAYTPEAKLARAAEAFAYAHQRLATAQEDQNKLHGKIFQSITDPSAIAYLCLSIVGCVSLGVFLGIKLSKLSR